MNRKAVSRSLMVLLIISITIGFVAYYTITFQFPTQAGGFENPIKTPHWISNTPAHEAILAGVPINVVIDFNFDLGPPSNIRITANGTDYGFNVSVIDPNRLALRRPMNQSAPDGLYTVVYDACWPDGSCHEGRFQFRIDRTKVTEFVDMRGQLEVFVNITDFEFRPKNLLISTGAKVTWINRGDEEHYINTDSHPAHTYFPPQNSRGLLKGANFSMIFADMGIYPYHCSAHASIMTATILATLPSVEILEFPSITIITILIVLTTTIASLAVRKISHRQ